MPINNEKNFINNSLNNINNNNNININNNFINQNNQIGDPYSNSFGPIYPFNSLNFQRFLSAPNSYNN